MCVEWCVSDVRKSVRRVGRVGKGGGVSGGQAECEDDVDDDYDDEHVEFGGWKSRMWMDKGWDTWLGKY